MNKLTGKEILEILNKNVTPEEFGAANYNSIELGLGEVEQVVQVGGSNQGSTWYRVEYFKDHDVYIRIDGWYQSYSGTEFKDAPYEVRPTPKTITVYTPAIDKID